MNYAEARKLGDGSGWHFTVRNDDRIWTHQCCLDPGPPATQEDVEKFGYQLGEPTLGSPHEPHATREEAEACLHQWRLEQSIEFKAEQWANWQDCQVCGAATKGGAWVRDVGGRRDYQLCDEHRTVAVVRELIDKHPVTRSVYS